MAGPSTLLLVLLLAAEPAAPATEGTGASGEEATAAGVAPVELIPRLELRQSFGKLEGGTSVHITTTEIDIGFPRVLLRYEGQVRVVSSPTAGQISGFGDARISLIGLVASAPRYVAVVIAGAVLDTASQPPLGDGKEQVVVGGAAAFSPVRWWLPYAVLQEQFSVAGNTTRPDVNQLVARAGNIFFGKGYTWYKLDLDTLVDFKSEAGRLLGTLEVGSLLVGRTALFMRSGTQLLGSRQLDYSIEVGVRYLFRLEKGK
jgi:hypothetical protein